MDTRILDDGPKEKIRTGDLDIKFIVKVMLVDLFGPKTGDSDQVFL